MAAVQISDVTATMNNGDKCYHYLKNMWRFVPGIQDDIVHPPHDEKQKFYDGFVLVCNSVFIRHAFERGLEKYGYPWTQPRHSVGGRYWAITLARAALRIHGTNRAHHNACPDRLSAGWRIFPFVAIPVLVMGLLLSILMKAICLVLSQ